MDFKPAEIALMALAFLVPVVIFGVVLTPGAGQALFQFAFQRQVAPFFFGGLALIVFGVLAFRIFRRIRPATKKRPGADEPSAFSIPRGPFKDPE